jgi:hypothetical protein
VLKLIGRTIVAAILLIGFTSPAYASSYRYWGFFTGENGSWNMSLIGAAENIPTDGSVDGWRFGIGTDTQTPEPRTAPDFEELCPGTQPEPGITRVAVVIDFGDLDQAPESEMPPSNRVECINMPDGGSSADALAMAADVRADGGFVCGIDGFPLTECGAEVTEVSEETVTENDQEVIVMDDSSATEQSDTNSEIVIGAIAIAAVLIAILIMRRSKK